MVLVTGSAGRIGSAISAALGDRFTVVGFELDCRQAADCIDADITAEAVLAAACASATAGVWLVNGYSVAGGVFPGVAGLLLIGLAQAARCGRLMPGKQAVFPVDPGASSCFYGRSSREYQLLMCR